MIEGGTAIAGAAPRRATVGRGWGRDVAATLTLAWPLVLANLAGAGMGTIDTLLIGRLGPESLAAAVLATNLYHAVLIVGVGLLTSVAPMVAAAYGARRHGVREIRRTVRQGLWLAATISVPAVVLLGFGDPLLRLAGQRPALAAEAGRYLHSLAWSLPPVFGFTVLRIFTSAIDRPRWGLAISLLGLPVNLVLAWALIFGRLGLPQLGLVGAGLATAATSLFGLLAMAAVILRDRRFRRYHVFGRLWRADWPRYRAMAVLGLPIAGTLACEVMFFGASGLLMGLIGTEELAAHGVALQISVLCYMVPLGIAQAATIRVGQAHGARDRDAIARAGWSAFGVAMAFMVCAASLLVAVPATLVGLFLDGAKAANAPVIALAIQFLLFSAIFQLVDGAQVVGAGMLRGLSDTTRPMLIAAFGYWLVGMPIGAALAFGAGLRGTGVWIGLAIGLAVVAVLMVQRWRRRDRLGLTPR